MSVQIFTSSWRTPIDDAKFQRVGISRSARGVPKGFRRFDSLAPGNWFGSVADPVEWHARYRSETLDKLDPARVVADLRALSDGVKPVVLLCWERPDLSDGWCHRGMISRWLHDRLGLAVPELGDDACRCGRDHPLLPDELRGAILSDRDLA